MGTASIHFGDADFLDHRDCDGGLRWDVWRCAAEQTAPQADLLSAAANTDVILASVPGGDEEDPFASKPAEIPSEWGNQELNNGGVHFSLDFAYANRYVYRGVNHDDVATHGNSLNLLFDGRLEFDLGKYPHPFVELFTNIYDADPVSRFQEIRPIVGADWDVKPFDLAAFVHQLHLSRTGNLQLSGNRL